MNHVTQRYQSVAQGKYIVLSHKLDPRLANAHWGDALRISQVLNNFVSNALKFTENGTVELNVTLLLHNESTEKICFSVKDTGIGIAPDVQLRLFQNYEQGSKDTARMYGGTGLGLAISNRLATLMGGEITLESAPQLGSTFSLTLTLPLAQDTEPVTTTPPNEIEPLIFQATETPHLLVVDDHPINRKLLSRQLMQLGLHAEVAENGKQALALWRGGDFSLIITDCHMPEMDGYELTHQIRALEAGKSPIPIIAWTANALEEERLRCLEAGMDAVLTKPTSLIQLREMLSRWLAVNPPNPMFSTGSFMVMVDFSALADIAVSRQDQMEILLEFQAQNHLDIVELDAALQQQDMEAIRHAAHRIKGAARMVGALALASICEKMETASKQQHLNEAVAAAITLKDVVEQLDHAIGQFVATPNPEV